MYSSNGACGKRSSIYTSMPGPQSQIEMESKIDSRLRVLMLPSKEIVLYSQFQGFLYSYINKVYMLDDRISLYWRILMVFYGIFNLDFGRYIIPAFCGSPYLKPFHITYLYYIPLIYLQNLFLIAITWLCIKKKPAIFFQLTSDPKNSMIDVFASFSFLSYAKLMFISINTALRPVVTWNAKNFSVHSHECLYSEPNVKYLYDEYLPFYPLLLYYNLIHFHFSNIICTLPLK